MKRMEPGQRLDNETALNWTLRIVGLLVFLASIFFVQRSLSLNPAYDYFFASTALLGLVTVAASWMRPHEPESVHAQTRPGMEIVRRRDA